MSKAIVLAGKTIKTLEELFSLPGVLALSQFEPLIVGKIATYFSTKYTQEQFEIMADYIELIAKKVKNVEKNLVDRRFLESSEGRRIMGKSFKSIVRDNRKEKLEAMANIAVNLNIKTDLTIDEKELYVDILDSLNTLQLAIMKKGVDEMKERNYDHRGLGWEIHADHFEKKGISKPLLLQSVRVLESNGLLNQNNAQVSEANRSHYITDFGEKFTDFVSSLLTRKSKHLAL